MKIIKEGMIKNPKFRFECEHCGCIFEAEENEVEHLGQLAVIHDGISYKVICPYCNKATYK